MNAIVFLSASSRHWPPYNEFLRVWSLGRRHASFTKATATPEVDFRWQTLPQKGTPVFIPYNSAWESQFSHIPALGGFVKLLTLPNMKGEKRWIVFTSDSAFDYCWGRTHLIVYRQFVHLYILFCHLPLCVYFLVFLLNILIPTFGL